MNSPRHDVTLLKQIIQMEVECAIEECGCTEEACPWKEQLFREVTALMSNMAKEHAMDSRMIVSFIRDRLETWMAGAGRKRDTIQSYEQTPDPFSFLTRRLVFRKRQMKRNDSP